MEENRKNLTQELADEALEHAAGGEEDLNPGYYDPCKMCVDRAEAVCLTCPDNPSLGGNAAKAGKIS